MPFVPADQETREPFLEIPLTQGKTTVVDESDYALVAGYKWFAVNRNGLWHAARNIQKGVGAKGWRLEYMHRVITGACVGQIVDHRDGDGLNNRRYNLRICDIPNNVRSMRARTGNKTSRFKGVYWFRRKNKWMSRIHYMGKSYHLGYFSDEIQAAIAYDNAARNLFGEFARPNFPKEGEFSCHS